MKYLQLSLFFLLSHSAFSQGDIVIKGKITLLSKNASIHINGGGGSFSANIDKDGSFKIKGALSENGFALIKTDSSAADGIWLEPGEYEIECREIKREGMRTVLLRTPGFKGPRDASIAHGYSQSLYGLPPASYKDFSLKYIDSILLVHPRSIALPMIISRSQSFIGDEMTEFYTSLLDEKQKADQYSQSLDNYLKQKAKIKKEVFFEDFSLPDINGTFFSFSRVKNKKLILIDFWSSDCYPCRVKHVKLKELYEKFGKKGLEIVSISLDKERNEWEKASLKDGISWINLSELKGWKAPIAESYFIKSLPSQFWLDGNKKILGSLLTDVEIERYLQD